MKRAILLTRSALLTGIFFANWLAFAILSVPLVLLPRRHAISGLKAWGHVSMFLLRVLAGTKVEFRGTEKIPPGPLLVASKHQSAFETFALATLFDAPNLVLKEELNRIPFFGIWTRKLGLVALNRSKGAKSLKMLAQDSAATFAEGRQLIIFPEGTRQAPGAAPTYKVGAAFVYDKAGVPCLPVALNSGVYWPRNAFVKYPGTIVVEVLDPIPAGLDRKAFMAQLETSIETASDRLLLEAADSPDAPPMGEKARARLAQLRGGEAAPGVNV
ncbi:lysophospholipid acyltransferase family protein [Tepidamorphus sp. 3E244]|uniref:lysophospholipid acyltransferase family protein n=1 Tax=Tepidamorphus sp. 3E244 TaxID=3385498 RepID=UPI0038FD1B42